VPPASDVQFLDQPIASGCTGFLIAPDILVSAGHCFTKGGGQQYESPRDPNFGGISGKVWIFDYTNDVPFNRSSNYITIPAENQYRVAEMLDAKLVGGGTTGSDYAIMRLDRPTNRKPFKFRFGGKVTTGDFLAMVGAPDGLPLKIADSAYVINNNGARSFKTNLDAFHGNSEDLFSTCAAGSKACCSMARVTIMWMMPANACAPLRIMICTAPCAASVCQP
jgi:hypothetical protein